MKQIKLTEPFDGAKFAQRYGLDAIEGEFFIRDGVLYYPDDLPDEPVLEPPDPPDPDAGVEPAVLLAEALVSKGVLATDDLDTTLRQRVDDRRQQRTR